MQRNDGLESKDNEDSKVDEELDTLFEELEALEKKVKLDSKSPVSPVPTTESKPDGRRPIHQVLKNIVDDKQLFFKDSVDFRRKLQSICKTGVSELECCNHNVVATSKNASAIKVEVKGSEALVATIRQPQKLPKDLRGVGKFYGADYVVQTIFLCDEQVERSSWFRRLVKPIVDFIRDLKSCTTGDSAWEFRAHNQQIMNVNTDKWSMVGTDSVVIRNRMKMNYSREGMVLMPLYSRLRETYASSLAWTSTARSMSEIAHDPYFSDVTEEVKIDTICYTIMKMQIAQTMYGLTARDNLSSSWTK